MDLRGQFEKRSELDKVNHEINDLNKKYKTNVDKNGTYDITDQADKIKLDGLLKRKDELEKELDEEF